MAKLSVLRWPVGIALGLLLVLAVSLSSAGPQAWRVTSPIAALSAWFDGDDHGGGRRELEMLQAAIQRIDADLHRQANAKATASLRTQRDAVVQRMREAASRLPAASLSPDIRRLIGPETASVAPPGAAAGDAPGTTASRVEAVALPRSQAELRVGLQPPAPTLDFSSLTLDQRPPWPLFAGPKPARRAAPSAPPTDRAATQQSAR